MFTIADVIKLLTRIFVKENKRFPKGLEGVDIRLKAHKIHDVAKSQGYTGGIGENQLKHFLALEKQAQGPTIRGHRIISGDSPEGKKITEDLFGKKGEVVDMTGKKIDTSKPILGGKNVEDVVTETVTNMKKMTPIDAMKEANSVIARKGKYKTLTPEESKKILKDTEDHIFERDIPDEDFAGGGVAGLLGENHRVPYGGGGTGRPPVTFTLTGGGGYGKNKNIQDMGQTIPGLNQEQYGYGFNLGTEIGLPWNFSLTGDVGIGRGSTKTDYKGQPIGGMSGVGETKLGDQWNVGLNWKKKVDFNKWLMGKADGGIAGMLGEPTYADGGRTGFKKGTKFDPSKRTFMKGIAALATLPVIGKYFKWAKPLAKTKVVDLTSVPIGSAEGMPPWFKTLVNRVIKEGDDVTKKFATKEREIVHTKKLGDPKDKFADEITVTQDLETGNVRVEYDAAHNMGEAPIQLDYNAGHVIEYGSKKGTKTKPQFSAVESEPRVTNWDGDIEWDGENIVTTVDDLLTDTTKLESYATGKKPNIKKLLKSEQKKKYVNKLNDDQMEQAEYIDNKTGHLVPESLMDEPLPDDYPFASGGRVPMLAGGGIFKTIIKNLAKEKGVSPSFYLKVTNYKTLPREVRNLMSPEDFAEMKAGRIEMFENLVEMAKSRQRFEESVKAGKAGSPHAAPIFEHLAKSFKSPVPHGVTDEQIMVGEQLLKNLKTKGRKLNAYGGLAGMLGE